MSDKFRKTYPIDVQFVPGELPSSSKLNATTRQARNGLGLIELAVGDIWNQSGDANLIPPGSLLSNALYITNLGRAIGQMNNISPKIVNNSAAKYIDVLTDVSTKTSGYLRYAPIPSGGSLVEADFGFTSPQGGGAIVSTQFKTSASALAVDGDWHVTSTGKLLTFKTITGNVTISYKPTLVSDEDATFNVVPDPNTDDTIPSVGTNFTGIKIAYANDTNNTNGFWMYLPPRKPLVSGRQIAKSPSSTSNMVNSPVAPFQDLTGNAQNSTSFRYPFCKFVADLITSATSGSVVKQIPDNLVFLYDTQTGTIIEGLQFFADGVSPTSAWVLKVSGSKLNDIIANDLSLVSTKANEAASAYKSRFRFIQPGESLTQALTFLSSSFWNHKHTNLDGTLPISHADLRDLTNNNSPAWGKSAWLADDHIQYLHRDGYQSSARDIYKNGLRGPLLMLSTNSGSNYFNTTSSSQPIMFNDATKSLYWHQADDAITVSGTNFEILKAGGKLQFEGATTYIDKTRADAYYNAIHFQKVYAVALSKTTTNNLAAAQLAGSISFTVPTGLVADVAICSAGHVICAAKQTGSNVVGFYHSIDGGAGIVGYTPEINLDQTNAGDRAAIAGVDFLTGATGAVTIGLYFFSDGTNSSTLTGRMIATVTLRI